MTDDGGRSGLGRRDLSRREVIKGTLAGGALLGLGPLLAACSSDDDDAATTLTTLLATSTTGQLSTSTTGLARGGTLRVGAAGGGAADSLDPHQFLTPPSIARMWQLYEPLAFYNSEYELEMSLADEMSPNATADEWTIRLKPGIEFHHGKTLSADDAIFSIQRIINPDDPRTGRLGLGSIDQLNKVDELTFTIGLTQSLSTLPQEFAQFFNNIVPTDFDAANPVGTGPFKFVSFTPGEQSVFSRHENYWREGQPLLDEVIIIDFPDDAARVNALLGGQVEAIDNLPLPQLSEVEANADLEVLIAETGGYLPFQMRVDVAPFDDVRVRQAMRLIVNRQEMIDQALAGQGRIANDLYGAFDPCFNDELPQREQDLDQAKSLLAAAGQSGLEVELTTAPLAAGVVEAAQVLAEQAKGADVTINLNRVDPGTYYGDNFNQWPFGQDFWLTRNYLPQIAVASLPESPVNETHWNHERFNSLVAEARSTLDETMRCEILREAQVIEYEEGSLIIWGYNNRVDAHTSAVTGFTPAKSGIPLGDYGFRNVSFV